MIPIEAAAASTVVLSVQGTSVRELSGLAPATGGQDRYFGIQDAGNAPAIDVLSPDRPPARIAVNAPNADWEDIAVVTADDDRGYIYIADTGDASLQRKRLQLGPRTVWAIVRVAEPAAADLPAKLPAEQFPVTFAGKAQHNDESIMVLPGSLRVYLVDKSPAGSRAAGVWEGPAQLQSGAPNVFRRVATLGITGLSGGAVNPAGTMIALRDGTTAYLWQLKGRTVPATLKEDKPYAMPLPDESQGESIAFSTDNASLIISSEGRNNPIMEVPLPASLGDIPPVSSLPPASSASDSSASDEPGSASSRWPLLVGGGIVILILAAAGAAWFVRRPSAPRW